MYWIKVIKVLKDLYGVGTIVKESRARVLDWEAKGFVERVEPPKDGKNKIVAYKVVKQSAKK